MYRVQQANEISASQDRDTEVFMFMNAAISTFQEMKCAAHLSAYLAKR